MERNAEEPRPEVSVVPPAGARLEGFGYVPKVSSSMLVVQLTCAAGDPLHVVLGHCVAPLAGAVLLALPLALLAARRQPAG